MGKRANGEGSIYPYRNGYAAHVWVTTPDGGRKRKSVYGKTREEVHEKWIKLHAAAQDRPVPTSTPTVREYLTSWLEDVIRPNREVTTYSQYEYVCRRLIFPGLGGKKLDRLSVRDVQKWLNEIAVMCQCCSQGKDAKRPAEHRDPKVRQRCCAIGQCCQQYPAKGTVRTARAILRSALTSAQTEELVARNVATLATLPRGSSRTRKKRKGAWSVEEARRFLESAKRDGDRLYAAYVLLLVMGLRKGELLGMVRDGVDLDNADLDVTWQLRRVHQELLHDQSLKTEESEDGLPMPGLCVRVLRERIDRQDEERRASRAEWVNWRGRNLVFTTRIGTPIDPRNFNRYFHDRCRKAGVPVIRVHDARHTCASLLAALNVHPRVAQAILRHSRISTTMEVYTEVTSEQSRDALRQLGESLSDSEDESLDPEDGTSSE